MTINAFILGNGPQKILVYPGWMGDHSVFEPTYHCWDLQTYTLAMVDFRGYGKSKDAKGEYTIEEMAKDGIDLADSLGWDRFQVIGHSMGGMVAQKTATLAPERVTAVAAITPVPASGYPMDADNTALFQGAIESDENRKTILNFTTGMRLSEGWLNNMTKASKETTTPEAYSGYLNAWANTDFSSEVKGLKMPFMVAVGEHDLAINLDMVKSTYGAWLENCEFATLPNAGHYPMQESPAYMVKLVEDFFHKARS